MNKELYMKLNKLLDYIRDMLNDIKLNGMKAIALKKTVADTRKTVTEILEKQLGGVSLEQQINISELGDEDWLITSRRIIDVINDQFAPHNQYDVYFLDMFRFLIKTDKQSILENIKKSVERLKENEPENYTAFVEYFAKYPLWGTLNPESGDYNTLELRADVLKHHAYDFLWLYSRLQDYLSRRTLSAILVNWLDMQCEGLVSVKSIFKDYWEPDIFPNNKNDVMVDLGAFVGDSIANYINIYGTGYKKIYAYEISDDSYIKLCKNVEEWKLHDVDARKKGVGASHSYMYVNNSLTDASANNLEQTGNNDAKVEIVTLDDDLEEIPTLIKMDIEGAEQGALIGAKKIISEHHPKLAVCIYHGYEDIWKIPSMIYSMNPEYKFYLRHNGGDLIPTEFVLLCKPN